MNAIYAAGSRRVTFGILGAGALALVAGLAATPAARADDVDLIADKGYASLGVFTNSSELKIRVDGEAGEQGTEIDWNNKFGDDEKTRFRLDGVYRFTPKHHMRMMYTDYSRSKTGTLEEVHFLVQDLQVIWSDIGRDVDARGAFADFGVDVFLSLPARH